jgi:hypothetical protein
MYFLPERKVCVGTLEEWVSPRERISRPVAHRFCKFLPPVKERVPAWATWLLAHSCVTHIPAELHTIPAVPLELWGRGQQLFYCKVELEDRVAEEKSESPTTLLQMLCVEEIARTTEEETGTNHSQAPLRPYWGPEWCHALKKIYLVYYL